MLIIDLIEARNYDDTRRVRLDSAIEVMRSVLNSNAFKDAVLNFTTKGEKTFFYRRSLFGKWIDHPYSNEEVYNMIMTAHENPRDIALGHIDLYLVLEQGGGGGVIGFGHPGEKEIHTYVESFDAMSIPELADHYTHEWTHKLGFDHAYLAHKTRDNSVPYGVGGIVKNLAEKLNPKN